MTLPSAIAMIVRSFPEPVEQSRALSIFGAFGAIGNAFRFVIVRKFPKTPKAPLIIPQIGRCSCC